MNSEITKLNDTDWLRGWVLYDGQCHVCRRFARLTENLCTRRGFDLAPLQTPWVEECLGESGPELLSALRVITPAGQSFAGADALLFLARHVWWAWPAVIAGYLPGVHWLLCHAYAFVAARRRCAGVCNVEAQGVVPVSVHTGAIKH